MSPIRPQHFAVNGGVNVIPPYMAGWPRSHHLPLVAKRKRSITTLPYDKKRDPLYIPRPPNSFMLFRKDFVANRPEGYNAPENKSLSKQAGEAWRLLPSSEKKKWAKKAHDISVEHARKNPTWKYRPTRRSDKRRQEEPAQQSQNTESVMTFHSNPTPPTLLLDNHFPHNLMRRRESLRLCNWDDSVLFPTHTASYSSDDTLYQLPEVLHRRSSSVPIPDGNPTQGISSSCYQADSLAPGPPPPSMLGHRLSYSGIRPGFMPTDIHSPVPLHHPSYSCSLESSLQPTAKQEEDPSHMFEGYKITYVPTIHNPELNSEFPEYVRRRQPLEASLYVSPVSQTPPGLGVFETDVDKWESTSGVGAFPAAPFDDGSTSIIPPDSCTRPSTRTHAFEADKVPFFVAPGEDIYQVQGVDLDQMESEHLVERMRSIDFGTSYSQASDLHTVENQSTYGAHLKPLSPLDEFFPQFIHHARVGELQLSGLNDLSGVDVVLSSRDREGYDDPSLGLSFGSDFPEKFDIVDEFIVFPASAPASSCGSGSNSPQHQQQLDLDSSFDH